MILSPSKSKHNFRSFLWHAVFLALASSFMDVDTIIPSMLIKAGGNSLLLGLLTAIMLGGSSLMQLVFAGFISGKIFKRRYLLAGINFRVLALLLLACLFFVSDALPGALVIFLIFIFISIFSFSGAFANVSYVDILGKSVLSRKRKKFFTSQQMLNSIGLLVSAFVVRHLLKVFDYPQNYSILFLIAAMLLLIASGGFWKIKEMPSQKTSKRSFLKFFKMIPAEIKNNNNLKYYLFIINILGLGLSILPFFILLAKEKFGLSNASIGNYLVLRIVGMLVVSMSLYYFSRKQGYKNIVRIAILLGVALPLLALYLSDDMMLYQFLFIFSGAFFSLYKISISGILMEISNEENRAVYAGISGAGNILPAIFPLIAGGLISWLGYGVVFISVSLILFAAFPLAGKLQCKYK